MKIMHLLQSNTFSAPEYVVCQIMEMFHDEKNMEFVYCSQDGPIRHVVESKNIIFYGLKRFSLREIKNAITEIRPDIIHAHDMHACFKAAVCCGTSALVCHIHNNSFSSRKLNPKTFAFQYAAKKAKHIYWVSDSSYNNFYYIKKYREKSSVLYNIINIRKLIEKVETDSREYDYDVIYLGRLSAPKNPMRLLNVLELVIEKCPNVKIAIVGTGDMENETKKVVSEKELDTNIEFLGFMDNPYKILYDSKLMIMTSLWEGTPMCSLEAMALGVPIVSTPTDGLCSVIENGITGILSDKDDVLVEAVYKLIMHPELRKQMSVASRERANKLMNVESYKKDLEDTYLKAVKDCL